MTSSSFAPEPGVLGLNYGCGETLFPHCINLDCVLPKNQTFQFQLHDAKSPLPFGDDSVDFIFSEHFIEHIELKAAIVWLREVHRVLKPGGVARLSTPDMEKFVRAYVSPSNQFQETMAQRLSDLMLYAPTRRSWNINQIFYHWGHRWLYDREEMRYAARRAGFKLESIRFWSFRESSIPILSTMDKEERKDESLYVELSK